MNVQRRKQVAELAAKLHPLIAEAASLAQDEVGSRAGLTVLIEPKHPYYADSELAFAALALQQAQDVLVSLPTIGAPR